ncbi:hypothetical protein V6N12_073900 [Hibiscus sabdariffa]|uniref:Endonuclease/exonuclease/phosphatase domain-containing protein n=1 Tax=Hibiscus sabdariffa TaxID=183260 RepID=A0ABR2AW88_9ROSI
MVSPSSHLMCGSGSEQDAYEYFENWNNGKVGEGSSSVGHATSLAAPVPPTATSSVPSKKALYGPCIKIENHRRRNPSVYVVYGNTSNRNVPTGVIIGSHFTSLRMDYNINMDLSGDNNTEWVQNFSHELNLRGAVGNGSGDGVNASKVLASRISPLEAGHGLDHFQQSKVQETLDFAVSSVKLFRNINQRWFPSLSREVQETLDFAVSSVKLFRNINQRWFPSLSRDWKFYMCPTNFLMGASGPDVPCLVGGDFNVILSPDELHGGSSNELHAGLVNLGFRGPPFTWSCGDLYQHLNRCVVNDSWNLVFLDSYVMHLEKIGLVGTSSVSGVLAFSLESGVYLYGCRVLIAVSRSSIQTS